jgi:indole-3-glycerol phosphate synthase
MEYTQNKTSGFLKSQTASINCISNVNFFSCSPSLGSMDHREDCNADFVIHMYEERACICNIFTATERNKVYFHGHANEKSLVTTDILAKDAVIRKQLVYLSDQICSNVTLCFVYSQVNKQ